MGFSQHQTDGTADHSFVESSPAGLQMCCDGLERCTAAHHIAI